MKNEAEEEGEVIESEPNSETHSATSNTRLERQDSISNSGGFYKERHGNRNYREEFDEGNIKDFNGHGRNNRRGEYGSRGEYGPRETSFGHNQHHYERNNRRDYHRYAYDYDGFAQAPPPPMRATADDNGGYDYNSTTRRSSYEGNYENGRDDRFNGPPRSRNYDDYHRGSGGDRYDQKNGPGARYDGYSRQHPSGIRKWPYREPPAVPELERKSSYTEIPFRQGGSLAGSQAEERPYHEVRLDTVRIEPERIKNHNPERSRHRGEMDWNRSSQHIETRIDSIFHESKSEERKYSMNATHSETDRKKSFQSSQAQVPSRKRESANDKPSNPSTSERDREFRLDAVREHGSRKISAPQPIIPPEPPRQTIPLDPITVELERLRAEEFKLRLELKRIQFDEERAVRDIQRFEALIELEIED